MTTRLFDIRREEWPLIGRALLYVISLFLAYYVLRPIQAAGTTVP